jgi:phenazine biosynthesis protein phzE
VQLTLNGRTRTERVGFYNTFVGRVGEAGLPAGVTVDADPDSGDIHAIHGPHFEGIQFHAESILTEHGFDVLHDLLRTLLVP